MWMYQGQPFQSDQIGNHLGFIYVIRDRGNDKMYYGQKKFHFTKTLAPLVGKTRKRKKKIESDWHTYFGSNAELNERVMRIGPDMFERSIIRLCETKAEMNYYEMKYQIANDVLLFPDRFYNAYVGGRINRKQLGKLISSK